MSPPLRRATDREDGMEQLLASVRDEMKTGFEGLNRRFDLMHTKVMDHGESIASLRAGSSATHLLVEQVRELSETLAAHRARCPYDMQGDITATSRWTTMQLAGGMAGASAGMWGLMQLATWFVQRHIGQ